MFELLSLINLVIFLRFCYVCLKRNIGELKEYGLLVTAITESEIVMWSFRNHLTNWGVISFCTLGISCYLMVLFINFGGYLFSNEKIKKIISGFLLGIMALSMAFTPILPKF